VTVFGYDVSHWNGEIDHRQAFYEGMRFCYAKCTEGNNFTDDLWPRNRELTLISGIRLAAYHFLRSDHPETEQADNLLGHIGDPSIPIVLDVEPRKDSATGDYFSAPTIAHVRRFREACKDRGMRVSLLYLPRWYWNERGQPGIHKLPPIINSDYGTEAIGSPQQIYPGDDWDSGWREFGGTTPAMLQFARKSVVGGHEDVDANAFRGALNDLDQWFMPPTDVPEEDLLQLTDVLNPKEVQDGKPKYTVGMALRDVRVVREKAREIGADVISLKETLTRLEEQHDNRFAEVRTLVSTKTLEVIDEIRLIGGDDEDDGPDSLSIAEAVATELWNRLAPDSIEEPEPTVVGAGKRDVSGSADVVSGSGESQRQRRDGNGKG